MTLDKDGNVLFGTGAQLKATDEEGLRLEPIEGKSLMVKEENGVRYYSTDGGDTWSQNPPEGVTISDGKVMMGKLKDIQLKDGKGVLIKVENGVKSFSTDGGETWSQTAPEGINADGFTPGKEGKQLKFVTPLTESNL